MEKDNQLFTPDHVNEQTEQIEQPAWGPQGTREARLLQDLHEVAQQMRAEDTRVLQRTWNRLHEQSSAYASLSHHKLGEKATQEEHITSRHTPVSQPSLPKKPRPIWRSLGIAAAVAFLLINVFAWAWLTNTIKHPGTQVGGSIKTTPTVAAQQHITPTTSVINSSRPFCSFQDSNPSISGNYNIAHSLSWSPDGKLTTTAWNVKTFDIHTCQQVHSPTSAQEVNAYWSPDGAQMLVTWANAQILDQQGHVLVTHPAPTSSLASTSVGATTSGYSPLISLSGSGNAIEDSAWSPDMNHIASVYVTGLTYGVEVWNATTGAHQLALSCANNSAYGIRHVTWSPDGEYVAAVAPGPGGAGVCVWNASDGSLIAHIASDASDVTFSADSQELAFDDGTSIKVYDLVSSSVVHSFPVQDAKGVIFSVAWSPNGKYIAAAGHDLHLLDASTGTVLATYHAAQGTWIENLAWSPDCKMVAGESYILDNPIAYVSAWRVSAR